EEHSTFGFPEIMFGLFPCTGAMSLLSRRVGGALAERIMTNGKIYSARELLDMGLVDALCARGDGEAEVARFIGQHARRRAARQSVERSRKRLAPLDHGELALVVDDWVDLAIALDPDALRVMDMLILMQDGVAQSAVHH
ncbi:MAG: enoyl-CoA hydratase-related protein, partial [Janthinobacterium lividum]